MIFRLSAGFKFIENQSFNWNHSDKRRIKTPMLRSNKLVNHQISCASFNPPSTLPLKLCSTNFQFTLRRSCRICSQFCFLWPSIISSKNVAGTTRITGFVDFGRISKSWVPICFFFCMILDFLKQMATLGRLWFYNCYCKCQET